MNERQLEQMEEKFREKLEAKNESYVADKLDKWISEQDEAPTKEAIKSKQDQLEEELCNWIDEEVEKYIERAAAGTD